MNVLAIEDHDSFLELMRAQLVKRGFVVDTATTLADGLALASGRHHAVILLDLSLPDGDGAQLIDKLRKQRDPTPIIVLTARGAVVDRVSLLEAGADDYLVKPFDLDELVARIHAVVRRGVTSKEETRVIADLVFDQRHRQIEVDGRRITLRAREAELLEVLLRHAGKPVHRDRLLSSLYGLDDKIESNALDVQVHHLRRRLAAAGAHVSIATVRGHGYSLQGARI